MILTATAAPPASNTAAEAFYYPIILFFFLGSIIVAPMIMDIIAMMVDIVGTTSIQSTATAID